MLIDALNKATQHAFKKNWDKIYIAVDIHDTIVHSNYDINELPTNYLKYAKETLQVLSKHDKVCLFIIHVFSFIRN